MQVGAARRWWLRLAVVSLCCAAVLSTSETTAAAAAAGESSAEDGLVVSSAGNGKEKAKDKRTSNAGSGDDEDKKTLSQQVKEGKYGLIQNEIFGAEPRRPGIISYGSNPDVPADTAANLGGLDQDEIWLAENHVLVLKGGSLAERRPEQRHQLDWPPIDDYSAPRRQVKIPPRPRVPPPFPVQLADGGPVQLIGPNGTGLPAANGTIDFDALPGGFRGFLPGEGPYFPFPQPPPQDPAQPAANSSRGPEKRTKAELYPSLPAGAVIVPPPSNQTDYDDEDQSIYYPPPYSFVYPRPDNSTGIPPGPLVPGIILPPPPDFFSALQPAPSSPKQPPPPPPPPPPRKSSTKLYKTAGSATSSPKPFTRSKLKSSTYRPPPSPATALRSPHRQQSPTTGDESITLELPVAKRPYKPLVAVYAATTSTTTAATPTTSSTTTTTSSPTTLRPIEPLTTESPLLASYYFYEEQTGPSSTPEPIVIFGGTAETPPYFKLEPELPEQLQQQQQQPRPREHDKQYYDVEPLPQSAGDYSDKLAGLLPALQYVDDSGATGSQSKFERSHGPRTLYYHALPARPVGKPVKPAKPVKPLKPVNKPAKTSGLSYLGAAELANSKPIYQYSFEASSYKRGRELSELDEPPQIQQPRPSYAEYQDISAPSEHRHQPQLQVQQQQQQQQQYEYEWPAQPAQPAAAKYPQYHLAATTSGPPPRDTTLAAHQLYFTRQDEQLLDDVTKEYFTMFGKKLSAKLPSTTPLYGKSSVTERPRPRPRPPPVVAPAPVQLPRPVVHHHQHQHHQLAGGNGFSAHNVKVHYGDHTPGPGYHSQPQAQPLYYPGLAQLPRKSHLGGPAVSLADDVAVNYHEPRPGLEPEAEFVDQVGNPVAAGPAKPNSYFAYRLPGDGGHFYFLTPHAISRDDGPLASLPLYPRRPRDSRLLRRRRDRPAPAIHTHTRPISAN